MNGFIYKITNRVNNKIYVGQTRFTLEHRWKQHIYESKRDLSKPLYRAFKKYGIENFFIESIESVPFDKLNEREIFWIAELDTFSKGYNATRGGQGELKIYQDSLYSEIKDLYLCGFSCIKIGELFNLSDRTIRNLLLSMNVKIKTKRHNKFKLNAFETQELINAYKEGATLTNLGKKYHVSKDTIKKYLEKNNVDLKNRYNLFKDESVHSSLINDYLSGMRYTDLELKYKSDSKTIKKILVMHGINLSSYRGLRQTVKNAFCLTDEQCLEAIKLYNSDMHVKDIAHKFKINITTLYELFKRYHVKCNRYNQSKSVQSLKDN